MYRQRARELVMKKDVHIQKLKMVVSKMEASFKHNGVTQDQINRMCALSNEELAHIEDALKQIGFSPEYICEEPPAANSLLYVDKQLTK